jgi:hypothetical protein
LLSLEKEIDMTTWLLRIKDWFQRHSTEEAYLGEAQNIGELERRMRELEERGKGFVFPPLR